MAAIMPNQAAEDTPGLAFEFRLPTRHADSLGVRPSTLPALAPKSMPELASVM
jgi:hypothetical protein